jgi:LacI family transcriptional regulator
MAGHVAAGDSEVGKRPDARRPRPTIYQVADLAKVSPATVSRVFNGFNVSPKYANAVKKAAADLGFRPNSAARTLRTRTSEVIALVIADIENPFFTALARGVEDAARSAGYSVVLCNSDEDHAREQTYLTIAASQHMAGVIITPASRETDVSEWLDQGRPVVSVDRTLTAASVDSVLVDNRAGAREATRTLFDRGYTRIACIAGPKGTETADERVSGWRDVVLERDMEYRADYLVRSVAKDVGGREAMNSLLALPEPPDAVFVGHNLMSIGVLEVMGTAGLHPETYGISVFGDLSFAAALIPPSVHFISLPAREMGEIAAKVILDRIAGDDQPARTIIVRN